MEENLVCAVLTDALLQILPEEGLIVSKESVFSEDPGDFAIQLDGATLPESFVLRRISLEEARAQDLEDEAEARPDPDPDPDINV